MDLDARVTEAVKKLKDKGFVSPYLRTFVVARINPLRWIQGEPPPLEEVLKTMRDRAARFNVDKIKQSDLANMGGAPDDYRLAGIFAAIAAGGYTVSRVFPRSDRRARYLQQYGYSRKERLCESLSHLLLLLPRWRLLPVPRSRARPC